MRIFLAFLRVQVPVVDSLIKARRHEACIVLEPRNRPDVTIVRFEVVVWRIVSRVEIEHLDVLIVLTSEQMSSI